MLGLKNLLLAKLEAWFGQYVVGLDSDSLQIGVWSGKIELRDVALKKEALARLKLPVEIRGGYVQHMTCEVPWTRLTSSPVKIHLHTLLLLVCANNAASRRARGAAADGHLYHVLGLSEDATAEEIDAAFARCVAHWEGVPDASLSHEYEELLLAHRVLGKPWSRKLYDEHGPEAVATVEQVKQHLAELLAGEDARQAEQQEQGMLQRLMQKVQDNLQITVENVHVRFEVDLGGGEAAAAEAPGARAPIAMGMTMGRLQLCAADAEWRPNFVNESAEGLLGKRRLCTVNDFSVYCLAPRDADVLSRRFLGRNVEAEDGSALKAAFDALAATPRHGYLLAPIDPCVKVTLSKPPRPQSHIAVEVARVQWGVSRSQVSDLVVVA